MPAANPRVRPNSRAILTTRSIASRFAFAREQREDFCGRVGPAASKTLLKPRPHALFALPRRDVRDRHAAMRQPDFALGLVSARHFWRRGWPAARGGGRRDADGIGHRLSLGLGGTDIEQVPKVCQENIGFWNRPASAVRARSFSGSRRRRPALGCRIWYEAVGRIAASRKGVLVCGHRNNICGMQKASKDAPAGVGQRPPERPLRQAQGRLSRPPGIKSHRR